MKNRAFPAQNITQNQPQSSFKTAWEYWLDLAKPKNAFRVTLNPSEKFLWSFKIFYATEFYAD